MLIVQPSINMLYPAINHVKIAEPTQQMPVATAAPVNAPVSQPANTINNSISTIRNFSDFLKQLSNSIRKQNPYLRQIGEIYKSLQQVVANPKAINNFKLNALAKRLQSVVQPTLQKLILEETNDLAGLQKAITDIQGYIKTVAPTAVMTPTSANVAPAAATATPAAQTPARLAPQRPTAEQGGYGWNPNETVMRNVGRNIGRATTSPFRGMGEFFRGFGQGGRSPATASSANQLVLSPKIGSASYLFNIES